MPVRISFVYLARVRAERVCLARSKSVISQEPFPLLVYIFNCPSPFQKFWLFNLLFGLFCFGNPGSPLQHLKVPVSPSSTVIIILFFDSKLMHVQSISRLFHGTYFCMHTPCACAPFSETFLPSEIAPYFLIQSSDNGIKRIALHLPA